MVLSVPHNMYKTKTYLDFTAGDPIERKTDCFYIHVIIAFYIPLVLYTEIEL